MTARDSRLHAFRPDLADARLQGEVVAERFVAGLPARISVPVADVRKSPRPDAGLNTQLLYGDEVVVFDDAEGFAWLQAGRDGYVGYVSSGDLAPRGAEPTHVVTALRSFVYPGPDMKFPRSGQLSIGSQVAITGYGETRGTRYGVLASGEALVTQHLAPLDTRAEDFVSVAERLIDTPYLWGGSSAFGIDCSGLVQLSMRMTGRNVLRDSDMQEASLGSPVDAGSDYSQLRRGDLVFWKGHVAIMTDAENMIHANGHTMTVAREGLRDAIDRIGYLYGGPTSFRRP
ncbi:cell wall-associated NlpC family hydrolase [Aminobacter lissarensis]|uniref:Cell wall-associated NlpC family hydrolase n=1 Tax=Aminobacter carboxidus TaxID=376165 RepID=A0A8E1WJK5_9HYPH|nr:NlpC/P60 family protein [Aminobacter lissarensis]MBB6469697.1 cell wall-associated NlpC family hydrolase [Aminobacter lissarensis]